MRVFLSSQSLVPGFSFSARMRSLCFGLGAARTSAHDPKVEAMPAAVAPLSRSRRSREADGYSWSWCMTASPSRKLLKDDQRVMSLIPCQSAVGAWYTFRIADRASPVLKIVATQFRRRCYVGESPLCGSISRGGWRRGRSETTQRSSNASSRRKRRNSLNQRENAANRLVSFHELGGIEP